MSDANQSFFQKNRPILFSYPIVCAFSIACFWLLGQKSDALGFTLLPHSGVSLVFTGIAVSVLQGSAPECATLLQGTIAAAAVINEFIAVYLAKKGFEWAGELPEGRGGAPSGGKLRKGGAGA